MGAALACVASLPTPPWNCRHGMHDTRVAVLTAPCPAKKTQTRSDHYAQQLDSTIIFQDSIQSMAQLHDKILIFAHVRCASTDTAGTTGNWECRWEAETNVGAGLCATGNAAHQSPHRAHNFMGGHASGRASVRASVMVSLALAFLQLPCGGALGPVSASRWGSSLDRPERGDCR